MSLQVNHVVSAEIILVCKSSGVLDVHFQSVVPCICVTLGVLSSNWVSWIPSTTSPQENERFMTKLLAGLQSSEDGLELCATWQALGSVNWQWSVCSLGYLEQVWHLVRQNYSDKNVLQNMEPSARGSVLVVDGL